MDDPGVTKLEFGECRQILAEMQQQVRDYSAMWAALNSAEARRSRSQTGFLAAVRRRLTSPETTIFAEDFTRHRAQVPAERPYFTGALASGVRFLGDARDFPSALHAMDPGANGVLLTALRKELDRRPGNVVDVGTDIGVVAASMARQLRTAGRVIAFEPSPDTLRLAAATIALNGADNVTLFNAAVSDTDGTLTFQATPGNSAIASMRRHRFEVLNDWQEITVPAVRLDSLYAAGELDGVTLLKIDVEGHEMSAIGGALTFLAETRPTVVYEYTPVAAADHGWTQEDSISLLRQAGDFEFEARGENDGRRLPFPLPEGYTGQVNVIARPVEAG